MINGGLTSASDPEVEQSGFLQSGREHKSERGGVLADILFCLMSRCKVD